MANLGAHPAFLASHLAPTGAFPTATHADSPAQKNHNARNWQNGILETSRDLTRRVPRENAALQPRSPEASG